MIGNALGWKYDHKPGIRTKGDKILSWPASLGAKPTKTQLDAIVAEYEDYLAANPKLTMEDKIALIDNANSLPDLKEAIKGVLFGG